MNNPSRLQIIQNWMRRHYWTVLITTTGVAACSFALAGQTAKAVFSLSITVVWIGVALVGQYDRDDSD